MATKTLLDINPYLHDPVHYEQFLVINVGGSTAIELGRLTASILRTLSASSHSVKTRARRASSARSR